MEGVPELVVEESEALLVEEIVEYGFEDRVEDDFEDRIEDSFEDVEGFTIEVVREGSVVNVVPNDL